MPDEAFRNAATMFGVKDVERAADFYRDSLGFTVRNIWTRIHHIRIESYFRIRPKVLS